MSLFYRFVVKGMDVENFNSPAIGMMTPYSAIFVFSIGVLLSNFVFNTLVMKYPLSEKKSATPNTLKETRKLIYAECLVERYGDLVPRSVISHQAKLVRRYLMH